MTWARDFWTGVRLLVEDWQVAQLLKRHCDYRRETLCRRTSDGTLWAAGAPQNFAYAMRGLFARRRCDSFHFYRVREWRGILVASRRVFWLPASGEFTIQGDDWPLFVLPPWPESVECARIDAQLAQAAGA